MIATDVSYDYCPPVAAYVSPADMRRYRQGATRLGIPIAVYLSRVNAGWKWCSGHSSWCRARDFGPRQTRPDGLDTMCLEMSRARSRDYQRRYVAVARRTKREEQAARRTAGEANGE